MNRPKEFDFFHVVHVAQRPEFARAVCAETSRSFLYLGLEDGWVRIFSQSLEESGALRPHSGPVYHLAPLKGDQYLLTLGAEEKQGPAVLKLWQRPQGREAKEVRSRTLAKDAKEAAAATAVCMTALLSTESSQGLVAIGLACGLVLVYRFDTDPKAGRRALELKHELKAHPTDAVSVTNLAFSTYGGGLYLFVVTESQVRVFSALEGRRDEAQDCVLHDQGGSPRCAALTPDGLLVLAGPSDMQQQPPPPTPSDSTATGGLPSPGRGSGQLQLGGLHGQGGQPQGQLCLYNPETKTALHLLDLEPTTMTALGHYHIVATPRPLPGRDDGEVEWMVSAYDMRKTMRIQALGTGGLRLGTARPICLLTGWGSLLVLTATVPMHDVRNPRGRRAASNLAPVAPSPPPAAPSAGEANAPGAAMMLRPIEGSRILEKLTGRSLFQQALQVAEDLGDDSVVAQVHQKWGDHEKRSGAHQRAMEHYLLTVGFCEPSHVIRNYLEPQHIEHLMQYLEKLHDAGLHTKDHTNLLIHCYCKLRYEDRLARFISREDLVYDVGATIANLRGAQFQGHAVDLAQRHRRHEAVLDIMLDDQDDVEAALAYVQATEIPRQKRAELLLEFGPRLVKGGSVQLCGQLMELCAPPEGLESAQMLYSRSERVEAARTGQEHQATWVGAVADFAHLFTKHPEDLIVLGEYVLNAYQKGELQHVRPPKEKELYEVMMQLYLLQDPSSLRGQTRRTQATRLLEMGWPLGESPLYSAEHMLMLCHLHHHSDGLRLLYERRCMYREVLQVLIEDNDNAKLLAKAKEYYHSGVDRLDQLWLMVLQHFASPASGASEADIRELLKAIEEWDLLPGVVVLQELARNEQLKLQLVKPFVQKQLKSDSARIAQDTESIESIKRNIADMRAQLHKLQSEVGALQRVSGTQASILSQLHSQLVCLRHPYAFKNSTVMDPHRRDVRMPQTRLPVVHFMCGHSYDEQALRDSQATENEELRCPQCCPEFEQIQHMQLRGVSGQELQSQFFRELQSSADGFSVVSHYFGKGVMH